MAFVYCNTQKECVRVLKRIIITTNCVIKFAVRYTMKSQPANAYHVYDTLALCVVAFVYVQYSAFYTYVTHSGVIKIL